jgi:hypothetical protein
MFIDLTVLKIHFLPLIPPPLHFYHPNDYFPKSLIIFLHPPKFFLKINRPSSLNPDNTYHCNMHLLIVRFIYFLSRLPIKY